MNEINKGTRIINFVCDLLLITLISGFIAPLFHAIHPTFLYYCVYVVYYFCFEFFLNQTPGKMITKTQVVNMYNQKPSFRKLVYRTLLRLNSFDPLSYLFGQHQGGHDTISKTRLVIKQGT